MPNRVVHLIDDTRVGGAESMLAKLVLAIDPGRFHNSVVSMMGIGPIGAELREQGISVRALGIRRAFPWTALWKLVQILRAEGAELLQTWSPNADLFGLVAARLAGVPLVVWNIRNGRLGRESCSPLTRFVTHACALLSRMPGAVIVNSQAGKEHRQSIGFRPKRWSVIPNGFDLDRYRPDAEARRSLRAELGVKPDAPLIGAIGRYHTVKDFTTFVRAAGILSRTHPEAAFLMAGRDVSAGNAELAHAIAAHCPGALIHLLGERSDIPKVLAALDIFTLTSLTEGFPNVVGEAMACAVPCVVTSTAGDAPLIVGNAELVVPPRSPDQLASVWAGLIQNRDSADHLAREARRRMECDYDIGAVATRYSDLYEELLELQPVRGHQLETV